jgi:hypothetical protein
MPNLIEDRLTSLLAEWIDSNRPDEFPDTADLPVHVARRDEIRSRPCVVLNASESKPIPAMPHTARVNPLVKGEMPTDGTPEFTSAIMGFVYGSFKLHLHQIHHRWLFQDKGNVLCNSTATRILPENAEAFSSLLVIEILEHNYEAAAEYGERAWALRKDLPSIPANLAVAYHYLKNEEKKMHYYEQAKKLGYHQLDRIDQIFNGSLSIE